MNDYAWMAFAALVFITLLAVLTVSAMVTLAIRPRKKKVTQRLCSYHVTLYLRPRMVAILDSDNCDVCNHLGPKKTRKLFPVK